MISGIQRALKLYILRWSSPIWNAFVVFLIDAQFSIPFYNGSNIFQGCVWFSVILQFPLTKKKKKKSIRGRKILKTVSKRKHSSSTRCISTEVGKKDARLPDPTAEINMTFKNRFEKAPSLFHFFKGRIYDPAFRCRSVRPASIARIISLKHLASN